MSKKKWRELFNRMDRIHAQLWHSGRKRRARDLFDRWHNWLVRQMRIAD